MVRVMIVSRAYCVVTNRLRLKILPRMLKLLLILSIGGALASTAVERHGMSRILTSPCAYVVTEFNVRA